MDRSKEIELYIKQSREEIDGGIWDGDPVEMFYMLEQLQAELDRYKKALQEIKNAAGNSQRDVFFFLKAEQALKEPK